MQARTYFTFLLLLIFASAQAQVVRCGTTELHKTHLEADPHYRAYYETVTQQMEQWSEQNSGERGTTATITIPVVVHVLWYNNTQNISDAQIKSQIDVLNEDFSGTNADQSQIPSTFKTKFGNAALQFCLATRKSNGDWTSGIERRQVSASSFSYNDAVIKKYSLGGLDAWDKNKYLNIWICNLSGGLLGYTIMPNGPAAEDGAVIQYNAFGRTGTLMSGYNKGRTATHEIGHWLGIFHIWGDDGGACGGSGDYIFDTPNQADATYGCPAYPKTDGCTTTSPGIMYMNYMDYTTDACMHMFTAGQVNVMRTVLSSSRLSIASSNGCLAPTGIEDVNAETFINVYPNPAGNDLYIDFRLSTVTIVNVVAYDMLGKEIKTLTVNKPGEQTLSLDITTFNPGLYTLVVNTNQGAIAKRFAVQH